MAATQYIHACRLGRYSPLKFSVSVRITKIGDSGDFEHGVVVYGWSEPVRAAWDYLNFCAQSSQFTKNSQKKRDYPVSSTYVAENAMLMSEEKR